MTGKQKSDAPPKRLSIATIITFLSAILVASAVGDDESGILKKPSPYTVSETVERFETAVKARGLKVFPRFDHAAAAEEYDLTLAPLMVISFGNPKYGTKFMEEAPLSGIDFPPKAIVYEDGAGKVWLAYNSAEYLYQVIFERHGLEYSEEEVVFYAGLLEELTEEAVK